MARVMPCVDVWVCVDMDACVDKGVCVWTWGVWGLGRTSNPSRICCTQMGSFFTLLGSQKLSGEHGHGVLGLRAQVGVNMGTV